MLLQCNLFSGDTYLSVCDPRAGGVWSQAGHSGPWDFVAGSAVLFDGKVYMHNNG